MRQTTQLTIRVDEKLKKQAQHAADNIGLSLSALVKTFLSEVATRPKHSLKELYEEAYFDQVVIEALRDKKITSTLEKIADIAAQKCT